MGSKKKEIMSFSAMAAIEFMTVALATLYKAAAVKGLSYVVVITYSHVIGPLVLLPALFLFPGDGLPSLFDLSILSRFVLLAFIIYTASLCAYKGIEFTSPTIASCISNLVPAFTFVFAVIFRMESLDLRSTKTQVKTIGTLASISGALMTILYKGPMILPSFWPKNESLQASSSSSHINWVLGGVLLVGYCVFCSLAFIVEKQIVKLYPHELTVGVVSSLFTLVIAATIGPIIETNENAWTLGTDLALITIVLTGVFGPCLRVVVHTWGLNIKGPLYVSIFTPFSIIIAAAMSVVFLGDALYLGSVIGATIILIGFYAVLWGNTEEEQHQQELKTNNNASDLCFGASSSSSSSLDCKIPLLSSYRVEETTNSHV